MKARQFSAAESMSNQSTVQSTLRLTGIGVHTGAPVAVVIRPSAVNTGITFVRSDLSPKVEIPGHYKYVVNTQMATTLGKDGVTLSTVEHLLAALAVMGVDNARVEVSGPEMPILDGSSLAFVEAIQAVGLRQQKAPRSVIRVRRPIEVRIREKWARVEPSKRLEIDGSIEWDHPAIGHQQFRYVEGVTDPVEFSKARTFGFLKDVEALQKMGLARGGSLENAVVLDHSRILNPEGLRFHDEFARHKVLDALGDFLLSGVRIQGHFRLHRAGHDVHRQILVELFSDARNYEVISSPERTPLLEGALFPRFASAIASAS